MPVCLISPPGELPWHDITPVAGSARQLDGTPADLLRVTDYPVEALCLQCGQPVRCERYFLAGWAHIASFSNPQEDCRSLPQG
jgi:hypothetical protein